MKSCSEAATHEDDFILRCGEVGVDIALRYWPSGEIKGISAKERDGVIFVGLSALTDGRLSYPKLMKAFESKRLAVEPGPAQNFVADSEVPLSEAATDRSHFDAAAEQSGESTVETQEPIFDDEALEEE